MKKIILITGGQRSGKSEQAERLALSLSSNPIYLATAKIWDEEFRQRVKKHQERRGPEWTNIEEEKELSKHDVGGRVVLIDCLTLWATNFFFDESVAEPSKDGEGKSQVQRALDAVKNEFDRFTQQDATFIFVTNEIGMGGVSENELQRKFTDLQGWMNQYVAEKADEVFLMVSGIKIKIK
ncbi:MAG: bifunctional adenosylcobinamide kinase/adenosylcobinamide-phosphate guanylyltransferase [Bacteroidaceae bacterium]|nr:bifunctional adenosylcobinamide kinase/adenosylcobinamide-phosphate guanylyltransferase [Bacteroidaceae bacterium]